jgi:hypothetical protein
MALSVTLIFVLTVITLTEACDDSQCLCCPVGQVAITEANSVVSFVFMVASGSQCPTKIIQCRRNGSRCDSITVGFNFQATKNRDEVNVATDQSVCDIETKCITGNCSINNSVWIGVYGVSGCKGIAVPVTCLLIVTLLKLLV